MDVLQRITLLEVRLQRGFDHLLTVMATQREHTDQAFDEVKLGLREQQAQMEKAMRDQQARTEKAFDKVKLSMLEQELAVRTFGQEISGGLTDLAVAIKDHEERLRRLEGKPPAA